VRGNFKFFKKPEKKEEITFFRHMAFPDEKMPASSRVDQTIV